MTIFQRLFPRLWYHFQLGIHGLNEEGARWIASREWLIDNREWDRVRYAAYEANDGRCECCARSKHDLPPGVYLNADHIKPRKTHPWLVLKLSNIQIICGQCNRGKSNSEGRDWRHKDHPHRNSD